MACKEPASQIPQFCWGIYLNRGICLKTFWTPLKINVNINEKILSAIFVADRIRTSFGYQQLGRMEVNENVFSYCQKVFMMSVEQADAGSTFQACDAAKRELCQLVRVSPSTWHDEMRNIQ